MEFREIVHKVELDKPLVEADYVTVCGLPMSESLPSQHCWSNDWHDVTCHYCANQQPYEDKEGLEDLIVESSRLHKHNRYDILIPNWEADPETERASKIESEHPRKTLSNALANLITREEANVMYEELYGQADRQHQDDQKTSIVQTVDRKINEAIRKKSREATFEFFHRKKDFDHYLEDFYDFFKDVLTDKGYDVSLLRVSGYNDPVKIKLNVEIREEE